MNKLITGYFIFFLSTQLNAQFFRGVGLFVGATTSRHRYINTTSADSSYSNKIPAPSHKSAEYFSWSVGLLGEFLKYDNVRWQTELEYCNKGAVERPFLSYVTEDRGGRVVNKQSYIQWNNYAKIFFAQGYRGIPYIMLGGRIEYNIINAVAIYPTVVGALPKIKISPDVAAGYEFEVYSKFKPFVELHYNPDLIPKPIGNILFHSRTWELRLGIIYRPKKGFNDDCNAPRYHGNDY